MKKKLLRKKPTELEVLWNLKREVERGIELQGRGHSIGAQIIQDALDLVDDEYEDPILL